MLYKCLLEPHHRVPAPILSILVGRLPQVSKPIHEVTEDDAVDEELPVATEAPACDAEQDDAWDKDWSWGADDDTESPGTAKNLRTPSPQPPSFPPLKESYLVSASTGGRYLLLAHKTKFVMLQLNPDEGEYIAVGQGSGCTAEGETITAVLCLPLFVPSTRTNQIFAMVGYSSGWLRVFSDAGTLLTTQLLERAAILSIKLRTPPAIFKVSPEYQNGLNQDEDITILFEGSKVVSIDGQSLWMVLRVCDGQRESGIDMSQAQTAFSYKKFQLARRGDAQDVVSLGPTPTYTQPPMPFERITTYAFTAAATSRYISVGADPMLSYHHSTDSSRPLMSAVNMASYVVSRVATPVLSFAKSWWSGNYGNPSGSASSRPVPYVPDMPTPPSQIELATPIDTILSLRDGQRCITHISLSPATTSAQRHSLAATSDARGRVILWDVAHGEMVRMWKGVRDASCGWIECAPDGTQGPLVLFLAIYAAKRGFLQVFHMRHGGRVGAFHLGPGWRLVPCGREPLGSSMVSPERLRAAMLQGKNERECGALSKCLLIGPDGEVRNVTIAQRQ